MYHRLCQLFPADSQIGIKELLKINPKTWNSAADTEKMLPRVLRSLMNISLSNGWQTFETIYRKEWNTSGGEMRVWLNVWYAYLGHLDLMDDVEVLTPLMEEHWNAYRLYVVQPTTFHARMGNVNILKRLVHEMSFDVTRDTYEAAAKFNQVGSLAVLLCQRNDILESIYENTSDILHLLEEQYRHQKFHAEQSKLQQQEQVELKTDKITCTIIQPAQHPPRSLSDVAATHGHLDVIRFIDMLYHPSQQDLETSARIFTTSAMDIASKYGHFDIVKYLHERRIEGCTAAAMDFAAANNHLEIVQFLHTQRPEGCTILAIDLAAANGNTEVVRYLLENRHEGCSRFGLLWALGGHRFEIAEMIMRMGWRGVVVDYMVMMELVEAKNLEAIQFLMGVFQTLPEGFGSTAWRIGVLAACRLGVLKVLECLMGVVCDMGDMGIYDEAMECAAEYGQLFIIEFLYYNHKVACSNAALDKSIRHTHWETFQFLQSNSDEPMTPCETLDRILFWGNAPFLEKVLKEDSMRDCCLYCALDKIQGKSSWPAWKECRDVILKEMGWTGWAVRFVWGKSPRGHHDRGVDLLEDWEVRKGVEEHIEPKISMLARWLFCSGSVDDIMKSYRICSSCINQF
jgi:hypothetical protein